MLFEEEELDRLLNAPPSARDSEYQNWWPPQPSNDSLNRKKLRFIKWFAGLAAMALVGIFIVFGPNMFIHLKWWYVVDYMNKYWKGDNISAQAESEDIITVPKIGVDAPIVWDAKEANLADALKNGVAATSLHAKPGSDTPIKIYGYSGDYWWNKNEYGNVFALLSKLIVGDRIEVISNGNKYTYIVSKVKIGDVNKSEIIYQQALILVATGSNFKSDNNINIIAYLESPQDALQFSE